MNDAERQTHIHQGAGVEPDEDRLRAAAEKILAGVELRGGWGDHGEIVLVRELRALRDALDHAPDDPTAAAVANMAERLRALAERCDRLDDRREELDLILTKVEAERDWLTAEVTRLSMQSMRDEGRFRDIKDERDRIQAIVDGCPRCSQRLAITPQSLGEETSDG